MNRELVNDVRAFRNALGQFATGVAVIVAEVDGIRLATTVSSFNSVSLTPPLVLFSLARSALSFELWQRVDQFAVTVLSGNQAEMSNRFARAGTDKWLDVEVITGRNGVPLLPGALAHFECSTHARYDGGDHQIVVGHVDHFTVADIKEVGPLIFYAGQYRSLASTLSA